MILAGWPGSAVWTIGTLLGVAMLFNGVSRVTMHFPRVIT